MGKSEGKSIESILEKAIIEARQNIEEKGFEGAEENLFRFWRVFAYEGYYLKQFLEACCGKHRSNVEHNSKVYKYIAPQYKEFQRVQFRTNVNQALMILTRSAVGTAKRAVPAFPVRKDQMWAINKILERDERRERQKRWEQEIELRRRELAIRERELENRSQLRQMIINLNLTYDQCRKLVNLTEGEYQELISSGGGLLPERCGEEVLPIKDNENERS